MKQLLETGLLFGYGSSQGRLLRRAAGYGLPVGLSIGLAVLFFNTLNDHRYDDRPADKHMAIHDSAVYFLYLLPFFLFQASADIYYTCKIAPTEAENASLISSGTRDAKTEELVASRNANDLETGTELKPI